MSSDIGRVEPEPDEWHSRGAGRLLEIASRSEGRAKTASAMARVTATNGEARAVDDGGVHASRHLGRVSLRTQALEWIHAAQPLPNHVAPNHDRPRRRTDQRRQVVCQRGFAGAREARRSPMRHGAGGCSSRCANDRYSRRRLLQLAPPLRIGLEPGRRRARLGSHGRPARQKQWQQGTPSRSTVSAR